MSDLTNKFFDINKLPKDWGILVFPISMSRITNAGQNARSCFDYLIEINKKIQEPKVGVTFVYGDYLYFHSDEKASVLKQRFQELVIDHKNAIYNLLTSKEGKKHFQIIPAFTFTTWNQLYLWTDNFKGYMTRLVDIAKEDKELQKCLEEDAKSLGRPLDENQKLFFLEESLVAYLISKGKINIYNEYVHGREKWLLWCYPGKPPKTEVYLFKKNIFNLSMDQNKFQNSVQYDLVGKKLYESENIDLDLYSSK
jgi:hypothetical protein